MRATTWLQLSHVPVLREREIHVWRCEGARSDAAAAALLPALDEAEVARAGTFRLAGDRRRYVIARAALRSLAAGYVGAEPDELQFGAGARGKPSLVAPAGASGLRFNVSHAGDLVLLAFARGLDVGVDVERLGREVDWEGIAARFFSGEEAAMLRALPATRRREAFFVCWSCKEALAKARGDGVLRALAGAVLPIPRGALPVVIPRDDAGDSAGDAGWVVRRLAPAAGYVGALAHPSPPLPVRRFLRVAPKS